MGKHINEKNIFSWTPYIKEKTSLGHFNLDLVTLCLWGNLIKCKLIICKSSGIQKVEHLINKYPTKIS